MGEAYTLPFVSACACPPPCCSKYVTSSCVLYVLEVQPGLTWRIKMHTRQIAHCLNLQIFCICVCFCLSFYQFHSTN